MQFLPLGKTCPYIPFVVLQAVRSRLAQASCKMQAEANRFGSSPTGVKSGRNILRDLTARHLDVAPTPYSGESIFFLTSRVFGWRV